MMYRLLQLFRNQPQLLADHAAAYGELVVTEIGDVSAVWKRQAMLIAMGLSGLGVAVVLAGVALMLWVVMPAAVVPVAWTGLYTGRAGGPGCRVFAGGAATRRWHPVV